MELTPIERRGSIWVKRDDTFEVAGARGGKARTCYHLAQGASGLVTAGSRQSPQALIVAKIAKHMGVPCRIHMPTGDYTDIMVRANVLNAEIVQHKPGYNSVIVKRARDDAEARGWRNIPFGMECQEAVTQTRRQVKGERANGVMPDRVVMPVGSGMSLAGVLYGIQDEIYRVGQLCEHIRAVFAIVIGADPSKRLDKYAPPAWREMVTLVPAGLDYHKHAPVTNYEGLELDPVYEAKCIPFLKPDDLLWVVGIR